MSEDLKLGFVVSTAARRATLDDQLDVDLAVQRALLQFDKGRLADRGDELEDRGGGDDSLGFPVDSSDDGLF